MDKQLPTLHISMFGKTAITYGGNPVSFGRSSATRVQKLFFIMIHSGSEGIARNKLFEDVYGREEIVDMANNFRVTVHRLKRMMIKAGLPDHDYIRMEQGVYYWSSPMELDVDTLEFRRLVQCAGETEDLQEKSRLLQEACEMYKGEFLEDCATDAWVITEAAQYKKQYYESLEWLCGYLKETEAYGDLLRLCGRAAAIYPYDEWQAVRIECHMAMHNLRDAIREYRQTEKMLVEELGISPSEHLRKRFETMEERVKWRPGIIWEIRESLNEKSGEPDDGAYYCSPLNFRDEYRFVCRVMERERQSVYLMLCTITDHKGYPQEDKEMLKQMSERLHGAIQSSLRRCDSFTHYAPSQFLILLVGTQEEHCEQIFARIAHGFSKEYKSWKRYLHFDVLPVGDEMPKNFPGGGGNSVTNKICG